ncbi:MAG: hypothetical protein L3J00_06255 [Thiomicrorhabdus sp.]|nr:hypothetical protein [Thiomicrorhabdus sp.]
MVHTITADNGKEFAYHEKITKALDAQVYFADPYSSWQQKHQRSFAAILAKKYGL